MKNPEASAGSREAVRITGGNPMDGREAMKQYGCRTCHTVRGVEGATAKVGPELNGLRDRMTIAGKIPNSPENLMQWIRFPHSIDPHTAMPNMSVTEQDAKNIAAYLYSLP
jgi:cytochrome c2